MKSILDAPCVCCGFNGEGYWQKGTHHKDCLFFDCDKEERVDAVRAFISKKCAEEVIKKQAKDIEAEVRQQ